MSDITDENREIVRNYLLLRSEQVGECRIWRGALTEKGYGICGFGPTLGGNGLLRRAHRLSYEAFVGQIPSGGLVCHRCDTPSCLEPKHLFIGTALDNSKDMFRKGRWRKPVNPLHLSPEIVKEIHGSPELYADIASRYGIQEYTVARIKTGETYQNVTGGVYAGRFGHSSKARKNLS